jgi:hypothetical protein
VEVEGTFFFTWYAIRDPLIFNLKSEILKRSPQAIPEICELDQYVAA